MDRSGRYVGKIQIGLRQLRNVRCVAYTLVEWKLWLSPTHMHKVLKKIER